MVKRFFNTVSNLFKINFNKDVGYTHLFIGFVLIVTLGILLSILLMPMAENIIEQIIYIISLKKG